MDTGSCRTLAGNLLASPSGDYCVLRDSADNTYFRRDDGGRGIKIQIMQSGVGMVGKVEFHPYGEYLWVYDTYNDNDALYFDQPEGTTVKIRVYDDQAMTDFLIEKTGVA